MQVLETVTVEKTPQLRPSKRRLLWMSLALLLTHAAIFLIGRHTAPVRATTPAFEPQVAILEDTHPTTVAAHNLLLRKGPNFRLYVRWIQGQLVRTRRTVDPTFDDPDSFLLYIQKGQISIALKDLAGFLNAGATGGVGALSHVSVIKHGDQIELRGTAHKLVPLPVKIRGKLDPLPDGRIQFHVSSFSILKIPLKGLLGTFHFTLADLTPRSPTPGIQMDGNNFIFDTQRLLPPPHIHGQITRIAVYSDQIHVVYGNAAETDAQLSEWHNFVKLTGGVLAFGKILMKDVDLTMIDASQDPWFDLDLVNYEAQFRQGYSRITKGAGLEIYMPDASALPPKSAQDSVTLDWLKHRSSSLPNDVPVH
jgi:hypothetical protein